MQHSDKSTKKIWYKKDLVNGILVHIILFMF